MGDGGENVHDYLHQSFNGSCQTWDVSERRKNEEQRTKIENECGGWNGNEAGEQRVAGKTSEIENDEGVWIEDCVELSRFIESHLDREQEDFELEVGSAGIGQPFKVLKQYEIHQGERVEVLTAEGKKLQGVLSNVTADGFTLTIEEKVREEGAKRPKLVERDVPFTFDQVKSTKYIIDFK